MRRLALAASLGLASCVVAPSPPPPPPLPAAADLRPDFERYGLAPRAQGARGTCSIFTVCTALEFACARSQGWTVRLSPEHLNWSASQAAGHPSDGNFFHNALAGFARHGLCAEAALPYRSAHDPALAPSAEAAAEALVLRDRALAGAEARWIVPWEPNRFGVNDEQFEEMRRVIAGGDPVAAGSAHSRLLVGYRDDPAAPGGGVFTTLDSALARFDEVSYQFVREQVADAFWIAPRAHPR